MLWFINCVTQKWTCLDDDPFERNSTNHYYLISMTDVFD